MLKIGMVGVGDISGIYLENLANLYKEIKLEAVCDLRRERAERARQKYNVPKIYDTMYELFADKDIDIVLNLTRPAEHFDVSKNALLAGKHVYSEKPLGATLEEGMELVALAESKGLMLGGAPDTFLGAGIQTCRKIIDSGAIGDIVGATATLVCHGHENWHPDPEFYYKRGGGPMMDMGPYYITTLINLFGRAKSVIGVAKINFPQRTITSEPHYGEIIDVEAPTHLTGVIEFDNGAVANITTTFDVYQSRNHDIEVFGTKGTLYVPDPNCFDGEIKFYDGVNQKVVDYQSEFDYSENSRGLGLADMAKAIETGRMPRCSYNQTFHVLEIMEAFTKSYKEGRRIDIKSSFTRQPQLDPKMPTGYFD